MSSVIPGLPNPMKLLEVSDPSNVANTGFVYTNDVSGRTELMYKDDTGVEVQLTNAGGLGKLFEGSIVMKEKAAAIADTAAYGQLWIKLLLLMSYILLPMLGMISSLQLGRVRLAVAVEYPLS